MESPSGYNRQVWTRLTKEDKEVVQDRLDQWVATNDVRPYLGKGNRCLKKLLTHRHRCQSYECWGGDLQFYCLDHQEWWNERGSGRFIITAHPYDLYNIEELQHWCEDNELECIVQEHGASWYVPTSTALIVVKGKLSETY